MRGHTLTETLVLVSEECCNCGVTFAMAKKFKEQRLRDRQTFYCPAGHGQHYTGETDADKLRRAEQRNRALKDQLDAAEASRAAYKGQATKYRNQVARTENGVCPHCNRSFVDLRRHMGSKHQGVNSE
jgi:ssDNA-binding Zn-finger/Zn-ribbon topoisomerase 1